MRVPDDLKYARTHQWVRTVDALATVGITDFAQDELGDIVYLQLPEVGATVSQGERMGEIESVKTVSDLVSPISGDVVERNAGVLDAPDVINRDPYGDGWLLRIRPSDEAELSALLSASDYVELTEHT